MLCFSKGVCPLRYFKSGSVLAAEEMFRQNDAVIAKVPQRGRSQRLSVRRMNVDNQVGGELSFPAYRNIPGRTAIPAALRFRHPTELPEPRRAFFHANSLPCLEPMFGRGFLKVHHGTVVLLVTEQPAQAHRRLKLAIYHSRPGVRASLPWKISRQQRVFRSIAAAGIHGETRQTIKRQEKRTIVVLADAARERSVLHEIRRAGIIAIEPHAENLESRQLAMAEMSGV